jgi:hypothetical protein
VVRRAPWFEARHARPSFVAFHSSGSSPHRFVYVGEFRHVIADDGQLERRDEGERILVHEAGRNRIASCELLDAAGE